MLIVLNLIENQIKDDSLLPNSQDSAGSPPKTVASFCVVGAAALPQRLGRLWGATGHIWLAWREVWRLAAPYKPCQSNLDVVQRFCHFRDPYISGMWNVKYLNLITDLEVLLQGPFCNSHQKNETSVVFCLGTINIGITAARQMFNQLLKITAAAAISLRSFSTCFSTSYFPWRAVEGAPAWQTGCLVALGSSSHHPGKYDEVPPANPGPPQKREEWPPHYVLWFPGRIAKSTSWSPK